MLLIPRFEDITTAKSTVEMEERRRKKEEMVFIIMHYPYT